MDQSRIQGMVRVDGVSLPLKKRVEIALTYIYGIGLKRSRDILKQTQIDLSKRVEALTDDEVASIGRAISSRYVTEGDLRKEVRQNIKRLQDIGSYRGLRHKKSLPARGQRTKTNARTHKGPRKAGSIVALKRKVTKK